ncbi:MAG: magnesium/cobalt transporter CorA [Proteobacteria bacterium]|nr:magnesium/cobalt transporter CorA [Pseudomonadota bacterium]MBU4327368.1 magnesium/cobalt transporter CorA [Pseudomonadota bacterium]MDO8945983.1 magnesium/cobalt transporter CorA [Desulfocapsaceae bacterium]
MARFLKKNKASLHRSPGSVVFVGSQKMDQARVTVMDYDHGNLRELELQDLAEGARFKKTDTATWINVDGVHDTDLIMEIGRSFELHPLILEDIVHTGQRPKVEEYDDCIFLVVKMLRFDQDQEQVVGEQLSMVLGPNFLLTFQEQPGDTFEPVRERIRRQKGRIRGAGIDYLAYALLDTVVDNYIFIIEQLGEKVEELEEEVLLGPSQAVLAKIIRYKREMNYIRKSVRPFRELTQQLSFLDSELISDKTDPFLKDMQGLALQSVEIVDTYREMLFDYLNIYNTGVSNKLNEIMKVLTIFSAIFIPLTFIAGVYGTNFEYFPELHYKYSYFVFWAVLLLVAVVMIRFFKRRGWL